VARTTPQVENGVLVYWVGTRTETVQVGSDAWQHWLDNTRTTTFRFMHRLGTFTARKEQRQWGGSYWYAYRKQGGRLRKGYLGRAEELTLQRLAKVATPLPADHRQRSVIERRRAWTSTSRSSLPRRSVRICRATPCWRPSSIGRPRDTTWWSGHA
jgi:hypothetical protein